MDDKPIRLTVRRSAADKIRREVWNRVNPLLKDRICRGDITHAEVQGFQGDSWDWTAIVTVLDDDAFVKALEYAMALVIPKPLPAITYEEALYSTYLPLLLERFKKLTEDTRRLRQLLDEIPEK